VTKVSATEITEALAESAAALREALAELPEDDAARKPSDSGWSAKDCVEHLALSERGMLRRIATAPAGEPLADDAERRAGIASLNDRSRRLEAPAHVQPTGRFGTLAQTLEAFEAARRETIRFVEEHGGDVTLRTAQHPLFGAVTGYEMLRIMVGHVRRHTDQIREIRGL
jgi:uncharacterized damage-inducible protein DinB